MTNHGLPSRNLAEGGWSRSPYRPKAVPSIFKIAPQPFGVHLPDIGGEGGSRSHMSLIHNHLLSRQGHLPILSPLLIWSPRPATIRHALTSTCPSSMRVFQLPPPGDGASDGPRTHNLRIDNPMLYQLSYTRRFWSGMSGLNRRPSAPKADALPDCANSRNINWERDLESNQGSSGT